MFIIIKLPHNNIIQVLKMFSLYSQYLHNYTYRGLFLTITYTCHVIICGVNEPFIYYIFYQLSNKFNETKIDIVNKQIKCNL